MTNESSNSPNSLTALSNTLAEAIAQAGKTIVGLKAGRRGSSSGIHWRSGIVVTTSHALRHEDSVTLTLPEGTATATLIGRDPAIDLAVLRLPDTVSLPAANLGDTAQLRVGHLVVAVGRSLDTGVTASMGIVSAIGGAWRTWHGGKVDQFIRPDIALGGFGSALINTQGQILGMNTAAPRHSVLTLPAATIDRAVNQILSQGRIVRGYLGVGMQPVQLPEAFCRSLELEGNGGVLVVSVESDSPADRAGVLIGDMIVGIEDRRIEELDDIQRMLDPEQVGQPLAVKIVRGGQKVDLTIVVGERPRRAD
ncbi:S1C family serine protease [Leptolyngbya ohadii]|uniref:S1C family serine protease n=1 Tax=Leptolyngbya ohadii TaxID=1962290 RepID=UPI000B59A114|nr:trypsin-like peptidase domain-containing protein [Leptolyngbya ohadii]